MRVTINHGFVTVDQETRPVQTDDLLPAGIQQISFDQDHARAWVEYGEDETIQIMDRDLEAEDRRNRQLRRENKRESDEPIFRPVRVRRSGQWLADLTIVDQLLARWEAAAPVPPPPPDPVEVQRQEELANEERTFALGNVTPLTPAQVSKLSRTEFRDWFNANFTTEAQRTRLLRWLLLVVCRRVFG